MKIRFTTQPEPRDMNTFGSSLNGEWIYNALLTIQEAIIIQIGLFLWYLLEYR